MQKMLEEFVAYAKEKFGAVVKASDSKRPESFEEIFGVSYTDNVDASSAQTARIYRRLSGKDRDPQRVLLENTD